MDSRDIEARAGEWLARRESGEWSAEDESRFQEWLNDSTANRVAYLRLEGAWERASRLQALKGHTPAGAVPSPEDWRLEPFVSDGAIESFPQGEEEQVAEAASTPDTTELTPAVTGESSSVPRKKWFAHALAACLVLAAAGAINWYVSARGPYYQTPVGGMASVPMNDGSKVTLNTDSAIRLAVTERERKIELERGEAFFDVAKDPSRPFVVVVGNKRVVAVGTQFSVRRVGDDVQVFVTEGKVRLEDASLAGTKSQSKPSGSTPDTSASTQNAVASESGAMLLTAGAVARIGGSGIVVQERSPDEVEEQLSWRAGYLTFRDTALTNAIAEFNRYNRRQIVIQDPSVGSIRFSGKVKPTSFEGFVRLLEDAFQIRSEVVDDRIVLTNARHPTTQD
jgi:transmembrane sensor